ncbi:MAG: D-alanine--D-alanine ligase [Candidatus Shapirobacteria bacterium]|nr:D-alanine--D-alanine ligase [Candidatus Shapirobacteria bacterium]
MKIKVAILMGGKSSEREVSLMSGNQVLKNLNKDKFEAIKIDVTSELEKIKGCKVAFIALHGAGGEDGKIQGYLDTIGIKYTGCGVLASALGMDKKKFRELMERNDILMPKETTKVPCVVKPNNGGSSVGVAIVKREEDWEKAVELAKKYDDQIITEEFIEGTEVSCGILGDEVLPVVEIVPKNEFFDYEAKYTDGKSEEICPARLTVEVTKKVQETALKVFKIIGGKGFGRVDMIIRDDIPYVLEINTIPGLTSNSLLPKEAKAAGYSYSQMLDKIIELALG